MQNWFVSWQDASNVENCGYQIFESNHNDPAHVLAEQVKIIAETNNLHPRDILVVAFNKV